MRRAATVAEAAAAVSALSPESRRLSGLLGLLDDSEEASLTLVESVSILPTSRQIKTFGSMLKSSIEKLRRHTWEALKAPEQEMAMAAERCFRAAFGLTQPPSQPIEKKATRPPKSGYHLFCANYSAECTVGGNFGGRSAVLQQASQAWNNLPEAEKDVYERRAENQKGNSLMELPNPTPQSTFSATVATALISDSEDGTQTATGTLVPTERTAQIKRDFQRMDFWNSFLEAVHLQVASRTTKTWGQKKRYEIYQLAGPVMPTESFKLVRQQISKAFLALYDGSRTNHVAQVRHSQCRVYLLEQDGRMWIQVNIGRALDLTDECSKSSVSGRKKRKPDSEFIALVRPDHSLIALTASRTPSSSKFTPFVLSALEHALTCSIVAKDEQLHRFEDLCGTEPTNLLELAIAIENKQAVGRYKRLAVDEEIVNPIKELQVSATASLLSRENDSGRLDVGAKLGRVIASRAAAVSENSMKASDLIATKGNSMLLDLDACEKGLRKRKREVALGLPADCPPREYVRWEWKGETNAAQACWETEPIEPELTSFKCRIVCQGTNVFAGMHELIQAGYMTEVPPHVKAAMSIGGTICVDHGIFSGRKEG
jgi:hypothetical protein